MEQPIRELYFSIALLSYKKLFMTLAPATTAVVVVASCKNGALVAASVTRLGELLFVGQIF